jgi:nucleoid-associated protein YgaU
VKKCFSFSLMLLALGMIASCGPDATKAVGDAKSALERARQVEAPVYSTDEFNSASSLYDMASQFLEGKKNDDAYKKAVESKDQSEKSYTNAVVRRADAVYKKDTDLLAQANSQFADKIVPDRIKDARTDYDALTRIYQAKDLDGTYTNGTNLVKKLTDIVDFTSREIERVKGVIATVQDHADTASKNPDVVQYASDDLKRANGLLDDARSMLAKGDLDLATNKAAEADSAVTDLLGKADAEKSKDAVAAVREKYENASKQDIIVKYAADDLAKALPLIDDARQALDKGDWALARDKARDASLMIDAALAKAEDAFQKAQAAQQTNTIDLDRQREIEAQKKKAFEYIEEAKKRLEELRNRKKTGFLEPLHQEYAYVLPGMFHLSDNAGRDSGDTNNQAVATNSVTTNTPAIVTNASTNLVPVLPGEENEAMVEKYIRMAEDSYASEEYLDAIDYAREAIRLADVLLAEQEFKTYTVQLRPEDRDCLWKIAGYMYDKRYWLWPLIWRANKFQIQDPDLIYPGQEFKVPPFADK